MKSFDYKMLAAAAVALAISTASAQAASTPAASTAAAPTASPQDANSVVAQLTQRMDAVSSYSARIKLDLQMHSFPYIATDLTGTTTYQRPGHYSVTFDSLPALASAFQNVSGDIGDPAAWPAKYDIALDPSASASTSLVALRLTEKVKGQIDHALAFVNVPAYTVSRMEWYYVSGGKILMDQRFATVNGVLVPSIQAADIDMPGYKASANAVFEGYDVHVGSTSGTTSTPTSNK